MPEVDTELYQKVGALAAMSEERGKQMELLFNLMRNVATKDDLTKFAADCKTTCSSADAIVKRGREP